MLEKVPAAASRKKKTIEIKRVKSILPFSFSFIGVLGLR